VGGAGGPGGGIGSAGVIRRSRARQPPTSGEGR
jgi:hypothetical protein